MALTWLIGDRLFPERRSLGARAALILAVTIFVGAWIGARLATNLSENWLRTLFGVFLIGLGCYTLYSSRGG